MADPITDEQLRDFAAGLEDNLADLILTDEASLSRLAEIWAEEDWGIDVSGPVLQAVKVERFTAQALSMTFGTFGRIATGFSALISGRSDRP